MWAAGLAVLLLAARSNARQLLQQDQQFLVEDASQIFGSPQDTDTVFALGGGQSGAVQITGMLQNFPLNEAELYPINNLLDRPTTSYLDASWSNWIDQRLEMLDLFQEMLAAPVKPRCPHMQSSSVMDNGMVSYLASSRFGPAILTRYAQQADDSESDFDWDEVNLPEGESIGRTYEDAYLREEMSADADKAFKLAEFESKLLSQRSNLGYFGANLKLDQMTQNQLDGDAESLQPVILTHPNMIRFTDQDEEVFRRDQVLEKPVLEETRIDTKQLAVSILLFIGCCYVWTCLIISCIKFSRQGSQKSASPKTDLLVPLAPEGMEKEGIEVASAFVEPGSYYAPQAESLRRIAIPLMTAEKL